MPDEQTLGEKHTKKKSNLGKRDKPENSKNDDKSVSQTTPTRSELAEMGYFPKQQTEPHTEALKKVKVEAPQSINPIDAFARMRDLAGMIAGRRAELNGLYSEWVALRQHIDPDIQDPTTAPK